MSEVATMCLDTVNERGYGVVYGPEISEGGLATERKYTEVVLDKRLRGVLRRIDHGVPDAAIEEAVKRVLWSEDQDLAQNNRYLHRLITRVVAFNPRGITAELRRLFVGFLTSLKLSIMIIWQCSNH